MCKCVIWFRGGNAPTREPAQPAPRAVAKYSKIRMEIPPGSAFCQHCRAARSPARPYAEVGAVRRNARQQEPLLAGGSAASTEEAQPGQDLAANAPAAGRLAAGSPLPFPRCRRCADPITIPTSARLKAPTATPSSTPKAGATQPRGAHSHPRLRRRAASSSRGRTEPPAAGSAGAAPYLAPAGQRPHRVGQVLDPPVVHQRRLLPAGGAGAEARQVGVVVLLDEPSQSHVGGRAFKTALLNAAAWPRKLK